MSKTQHDIEKECEFKKKIAKVLENKIKRESYKFQQNNFEVKGSKTQKTFSKKPRNLNRRTGR